MYKLVTLTYIITIFCIHTRTSNGLRNVYIRCWACNFDNQTQKIYHKMMKPSCPGFVKDDVDETALKMRGAFYLKNGQPDVIQISESMSQPMIGSSEILVKVVGSAVNPVDIKIRENKLPEMVRPFPKIPGSDVCGIVVDTSQSVQHKFSIGDVVMTMVPYTFTGWGSACEFVAVQEGSLARIPTNISDIEAASLPLTSLTVMQGFQTFVSYYKNCTAGKKVLIQAGAGGLGVFAIQYCKNELGMTVYTTCSTQNVDFLKDLGADVVIDYTKERFEDLAAGMDVVFDPMAYMYEARTFSSDVLKPRVCLNNFMKTAVVCVYCLF